MNSRRPSWLRLQGFDRRSLGAFRIALGLALLVDLLLYKAPYVDAFYTDTGILTRDLLAQISPIEYCTALMWTGRPGWVRLLFGGAAAIYGLLALGVGGRWTTAAGLLIHLTIRERIHPWQSGPDHILGALLLWSLFLPVYGSFALRREDRAPEVTGGWPAAALLVQISLIYFLNAVNKSGPSWWDGTAVAYAISHPSLRGAWADALLAWPLACRVLTYLTLAFEAALPLLLFSPYQTTKTRAVAGLGILALHFGILPFLDVGAFWIATLPIAVVLLPPYWWGRRAPREERESSPSRRAHRLRDALVATSLGTVLWITLSGYYSPLIYPLYRWVMPATCNYFGMYQSWRMFAPEPPRKSGYLALVGELDDGRKVLLDDATPYEAARLEASPVAYQRLPVAFFPLESIPAMRTDLGPQLAGRWIDFAERGWRRRHPAEPLASAQLIWVSVQIPAPGRLVFESTRLIHEKSFASSETRLRASSADRSSRADLRAGDVRIGEPRTPPPAPGSLPG